LGEALARRQISRQEQQSPEEAEGLKTGLEIAAGLSHSAIRFDFQLFSGNG
jgi:hypothetical protein